MCLKQLIQKNIGKLSIIRGRPTKGDGRGTDEVRAEEALWLLSS